MFVWRTIVIPSATGDMGKDTNSEQPTPCETWERTLLLSNLLPLKTVAPVLWGYCVLSGSGSQGRKMSLMGDALKSHKVESTHTPKRQHKKEGLLYTGFEIGWKLGCSFIPTMCTLCTLVKGHRPDRQPMTNCWQITRIFLKKKKKNNKSYLLDLFN